MTLRAFSQAPAVLPFTPRAWGYNRRYRSEAKARRRISNSRDWFLVWMGALSFIIAHARNPSDGSPPARVPRPTTQESQKQLEELEYEREDWDRYLYQYQHLQRFARELGSSLIADPKTRVPRAGLIVDVIHKDDRGQPSILWLLENNVPVWYPWNEAVAKYASQNSLNYLAPPPHLIQGLQTTFYSTPSTLPKDAPAPAEPAQSSSPLDPANMAARHQEILDIIQKFEKRIADKRSSPEWTSEDEQRALNRARKPPTTSANVYVYEPSPNDPQKLERTTVSKAERDDTLGEYTESQTRYFAELNIWVCCSDLVLSQVVPYDGEDDDDGSGFFPEVVVEPLTSSDTTSSISATKPDLAPLSTVSSFSPTVPPKHLVVADTIPPCYRDHLYKDPQGHQHLEAHLLDFMTTFFGYIPPSPLPSGRSLQAFDAKDRSIFLRGLGVHPLTPAAPAFIETLISRHMHTWLHQCLDNDPKKDGAQTPQLRNWDITPGSPSAVTHPSLRHLRILPSSHKNALLEFHHLKHYWFIFDDSVEECGWKLTVTTATHALAVLRLRQWGKSYHEIGMCFLRRGVLFQTFQTFQPPLVQIPDHSTPSRLPNRDPGHEFTKDDYHTYCHHRNVLLGNPRTRAALLRGGILWRLAASSYQCEDVLEGPTNSSDTLALEQSIDDSLSKVEEGLLVGAYVCYTGHGKGQVSTKSWWPLPEVFEKGEDLGFWSPFNETWYQDRADEILNRNGKPLSKAEWREKVRGRAQVRSLRVNLEIRSRTCLQRLAPGASSGLGRL
ncbi:hypothetical protein BKA70DRAFT_1111995 [Coprinopsis sp. MPI-PUGE-AT-0042]|nr:hypothetical protein BKA70DRAFT_1111995 [Coprinopsis sp. MPI-PUGE-AT-0042]